MSNKPFISIIIPAFNEEEYLKIVLSALSRQTYPRELFEVIVIDNNSKDRTGSIAKEYADVYDLFIDKPVGKVRNRGVELSKGEFLLFLDSDCVVDDCWVSKCAELLLNNDDKVYGGGVYLRELPYFLEKYWLLDSIDGGVLAKELIGASIAVRKEHFDLVGGFSQTLTSGEDSQFHRDLVEKGVDVEMTRQISVVHLGNATTFGAFLKRQIWHAESYFSRSFSSLKEPVFIFTLIFLLTHILAFIDFDNFIIYLFIIFTLVSIRSFHRIKVSENMRHFKNILQIMVLDYLYFLGRAAGFIAGTIKAFYKK